jgi:hypothetical protein
VGAQGEMNGASKEAYLVHGDLKKKMGGGKNRV